MNSLPVLEYQLPRNLIYNDNNGFPERTFQEAIEDPELSADLFLEHLEYVCVNYETLDVERYYGAIHAFYLLAQFRDQRAFPVFLKVLSLPDDFSDCLFHGSYNDIECILAMVYNGDFEALSNFIENDQIDDIKRGSALASLSILYQEGTLELSFIIDYLRSLLDRDLVYSSNTTYKGGWILYDLAIIVVELDIAELRSEVQELVFRTSFHPTIFCTEEEKKKLFYEIPKKDFDFKKTKIIFDARGILKNDFPFLYFTDEEYALSEAKVKELFDHFLKTMEEEKDREFQEFLSTRNTLAVPKSKLKTNRNDPCICGSGKKYKKCCST